MVRGAAGVVLALLLACGPAAAQPAADPRPALLKRAGTETPLAKDLEELTDRVGGRPTGSPACTRAVTWALARLRALKLPRAYTESFTLPVLWLPGTVEVRVTAPEAFVVRGAAAPASPSTAPLEARVVDAGEGTQADFARLGKSFAGAILLVHQKEMTTLEQLFEEYMRSGPLLASARAGRAVAVLLESTRPRGLLYRHPVDFGVLAPLPAVVISRESAERMGRLLAHGEVRARVVVQNQTGGTNVSENVIGEIPGREKPDEVVLLGAHLDSWDLGTGAEDDGVNVALVLDVARAFMELGLVPRRTVRFVLFTGEEQGMFGSAGYADRHKAELRDHVAVVVFDEGSGHTNGFAVGGRKELRAAVAHAFSGVPGLQEESAHSLDAFDGMDTFDFLLAGVPTFAADQDAAPYLPDYHAESDVYEHVNLAEARRNAGLAAVLVWALAEAPAAPGKHQSRSEVEALLKATQLEDQMKAFGQWSDWVAGKRGFPRPP
ncbi:MAG: M20/M25/M40 family metallo-hydrolase [Myxococcaceae bacterium]